MSMDDDSIEALFQEKLILYHELAELLNQEKEQILEADVAALWKMSEKKQKLTEEILRIRDRILKVASAMSIDHGMTPGTFKTFRLLSLLPVEQSRRLGGIESSLLVLKKEIRNISLESKQYIESKLGMINELISVMTGRKHQHQGYGATPTGTGSGTPMLIRREV